MLETSPELEVADLGLLTRFGNGVSALSPFEGKRDRDAGGARVHSRRRGLGGSVRRQRPSR